MRVRYRPEAAEAWRRQHGQSAQRDDGLETTTLSGMEVKPLYSSNHLDGIEEEFPGQYPYTRGIHASGYRSRLWTMRQFSGFATAEQTNRRYHYLLANGQTGLSVAFDMPTLMGQDSDAPTSRGEIGHCGVAIDSLADMETLFEGIPLGEVSTSMTINSPAAILLAMYLAVAEKQGVGFERVNGTLQNDILMPHILEAVRAYCTEGEVMSAMVDVFGLYTEKAVI
jgi:methylmalonyl-CoA mutase N-terminal domain/subunit